MFYRLIAAAGVLALALPTAGCTERPVSREELGELVVNDYELPGAGEPYEHPEIPVEARVPPIAPYPLELPGPLVAPDDIESH